MKISTLLLVLAGLGCFLAGAYFAPLGERSLGIALMAAGLVFQLLALRQIKRARRGQAEQDTIDPDAL